MERWRSDWDDEPEPSDEEALGEEFGSDWELDPNDPSHPDYDLSEAASYAYWEPRPKPVYLRRGFVLAVTLLVVFGLLLPTLVIIF